MPPENRRYRQQVRRGPDMSTWTEEERQAIAHKQKLATPIAEMKLSVRVINTLEENDVILAEQLLAQTYESLIQMKNFGEKTLKEVRAALAKLGLPSPTWKKPHKPKKPARPKRNGSDMFNIWG